MFFIRYVYNNFFEAKNFLFPIFFAFVPICYSGTYHYMAQALIKRRREIGVIFLRGLLDKCWFVSLGNAGIFNFFCFESEVHVKCRSGWTSQPFLFHCGSFALLVPAEPPEPHQEHCVRLISSTRANAAANQSCCVPWISACIVYQAELNIKDVC